jgi:hypothetical protein
MGRSTDKETEVERATEVPQLDSAAEARDRVGGDARSGSGVPNVRIASKPIGTGIHSKSEAPCLPSSARRRCAHGPPTRMNTAIADFVQLVRRVPTAAPMAASGRFRATCELRSTTERSKTRESRLPTVLPELASTGGRHGRKCVPTEFRLPSGGFGLNTGFRTSKHPLFAYFVRNSGVSHSRHPGRRAWQR